MAFVVYRWFKTLSPRHKVYLGVGLGAYACAGMWLTNRLEEHLGIVPDEHDQKELDELVQKVKDKLPKFKVVERKDK